MKKLIFMLFFSIGLSAQNFDFECGSTFSDEGVTANSVWDEDGVMVTLSNGIDSPESRWLPERFILNIEKLTGVTWVFSHRLVSTENYAKTKRFDVNLPSGKYRYKLSLLYRYDNGIGFTVNRNKGIEFTITRPTSPTVLETLTATPGPGQARLSIYAFNVQTIRWKWTGPGDNPRVITQNSEYNLKTESDGRPYVYTRGGLEPGIWRLQAQLFGPIANPQDDRLNFVTVDEYVTVE